MARVITFSRTFPKGHPKEGKPTYFVEKFWASLVDQEIEFPEFWSGWFDLNCNYPFDGNNFPDTNPKNHTIRSGNRWKVGDKFSPRVWSGKPYQSKMIQFAPDIEIKKIWEFEMDLCGVYSIDKFYVDPDDYGKLALNDGLTEIEMHHWFMPNYNKPKEFRGQIICWNENINY
jgi:hypothetical protein